MTAKTPTATTTPATPEPVMLPAAPLVWIHVAHETDPERQKALVTTALEQGFPQIVVPADRKDTLVALGRFQPLVRLDDGGPGETVVADDAPVGRWITLRSKADEGTASGLAGTVDHLIVSASDWKIIPLENLIADYQPTRSRLLAEVEDAEEAAVMLSTLEVGTDGVVLSPKDPQDIIDLRHLIDEMGDETLDLSEAEVVSVTDAGTGERVCIDTCSILRPGEGMLVGGSAQGLFLLHSESLESEYVNARPFRVNAGAVYAYVLGTEGRTHYLSELEAGTPLVAVDHNGQTRRVTVGRAKVETRPLLLVKARETERPDAPVFGVVVQNAETIRFVTPEGGALSVVDARPGDRVLLVRSDSARHFGRAIRETITER